MAKIAWCAGSIRRKGALSVFTIGAGATFCESDTKQVTLIEVTRAGAIQDAFVFMDRMITFNEK